MSTPSPLTSSSHQAQPAHESGYLIEALFLLTILATAIAVFMSIFSLAARRGNESAALDAATHAAANVAERFSADPTSAQAEYDEDGYRVTCDITPEQTEAGTLYRAKVTVWADSGEELYAISTARYVSGVS
ncbi:MAG: hypothetical protein IJ092_09480 [Atopobiaceae bacterium]|nr:hypothetical protein [Atopobiaceae bacterium]MBR1829241.1 hypothetical protein [Atopobiaceae bacterium]